MSQRRFEASSTPREHIQSQLNDYGISRPKEWRRALGLETPLDGEEGMEYDYRSFEKLITFLDGERKISQEEKIEKFRNTQDSIERLEVLISMSFRDAIASIRDYSATKGSYLYLATRLDFYEKLIQGKATKRETISEWDSKKNKYIQVEKDYPIDASQASPETVRLGLLRDIEFAAMIGTPELGIYKIVHDRLKENNIFDTHMPKLRGYRSGIHEGSIGYAYPVLRKLYKKACRHVERRMGDKKAEEQIIEHQSVILASNWLEEAMNYNDPARGPKSPYVSSLDEAIAWGRLGPQVKKQLYGMRRKIQGVDLHNIERFVGKSGDSKYDPERKRLFGQIKFLKESYDLEKIQEFTRKENGFAIWRQDKWYENEIERLNHRLEKARAEIENANLPDEERELQLQSVLVRHQIAVTKVEQDYRTTVARLQARTPDQLLADLEERQSVVIQRHEKRKSLAQMALDLHFKINHAVGDYDSKPLADIVDWINYAPFGTIKRAHKMMRMRMSDQTIVEYALADIIAGARCATRKDIEVIHELVEKVKRQDLNARHKLVAMMKVGYILSVTGNEVSLDVVIDLAGKNYNGMTEALKMYDLKQVVQFINMGINLQSLTTTRTITQKHGYELSPNEVAEITSHDITGLDDSLRSFNLDQVRALLKQDIYLPVAVAVLKKTSQFGNELSFSQIANLAKKVKDIDDFASALRDLTLSEIEKLLTVGVSYESFKTVKSALEKHGHSSDFNSSFSVAQKLANNGNTYRYLDDALQFYSLDEIDQIITKDLPLYLVVQIRQVLEEKGIPTTLEETIQFAQYSGGSSHWLSEAINIFGIDSVRKIVSKGCSLFKAIEVNDCINSSTSNSLREGGLDFIIALAKAGDIKFLEQTIEAGYTVEEIIRFPFLMSPLLETRKEIN